MTAGPIVWLALAWCTGTMIGGLAVALSLLWLMLTPAGLALSWWCRRSHIAVAQAALLFAAVCLAGGWASLAAHHVPHDSVARYIQPEPALARLRGTVDSRVALTTSGGAFAGFDYRPPGTGFTVRVEQLYERDAWRASSGRLLIKVAQADHRITPGDRLELAGWLGEIEGPRNPGEYDYRAALLSQGIYGRLSVPGRLSVTELPAQRYSISAWLGRITDARQRLADTASDALMFALPEPQAALEQGDEAGAVAAAKRRAFLDAVLLGRRGDTALRPVADDFRGVGLAHILAVSGAHLAILLGMVWFVLRLTMSRPSRVAALLLVVLGLYLLAVPAKVPVMRAGIAAVIVVLGYLTGRVTRGLDLVALAGLVLLIWRPMDLFTAGFQLSFGAVIALMLFTRPLSYRLLPGPALIEDDQDTPATPVTPDQYAGWQRWLADACAAAIVAGLITFPVVAFHFGMVTPLGPLLTVLALPAMIGIMGLGYLKLIASVLFPSLGMVLAGPLAWLTDIVLDLVTHAGSWPGATFELDTPPSMLWTLATLLVVTAWLSPRLRAHWSLMAVASAVCITWLVGIPGNAAPAHRHASLMQVNMFDVGDGSCVLVQLPAATAATDATGHTIMFDCGSQQYFDVGSKSIVPALAELGVERIDTLIVSHADIDHYGGVLDVIAAVPVGRVLVPPQLLREAAAGSPDQDAASFLVQGIEAAAVPIIAVSQGWSERQGGARLQIHWPPTEAVYDWANDSSLVLSISAADADTEHAPAALLLTGDIARVATPRLLEQNAMPRALVTDLPHHGSFLEQSPRWLMRIEPQLVLQSSGPARLRRDPWPPLLEELGIHRLVTERLGMIELWVDLGGSDGLRPPEILRHATFVKQANGFPQTSVQNELTSVDDLLEKRLDTR